MAKSVLPEAGISRTRRPRLLPVIEGHLELLPHCSAFRIDERRYLQVFLFDQTGKFLFIWNVRAQLHFGVADIDINRNELDLLNYLRKSIFKYDLNGQLLEVLPISERFTKFKRLQKNGYAFDTDNSPSVDSGAPFAVALWKTGKKTWPAPT